MSRAEGAPREVGAPDEALDLALERIARESLGERMHELMARLFPICRSSTGDGVRETLRFLGELVPLDVWEIPTGTQVFDWTVPKEWNIRDAYVRDAAGRRVIDFRRSNLHVLGYSVPVAARMTRDELRPHLHSLPEQPDAIPYRTSVYEPRWGFCVAHRQLASLPDGTYDVRIDSTLEDGSLTLGEAVLEGESDREVLFSTYVCHPSLCNDNLSGPVLLAYLYQALRDLPRRRYTYRFAFVPETIGALAFLSRRGERLRSHLDAGYVVTCVGDPGPYTYKRSRRGDTLADKVASHVLRHHASSESIRIHDFFPLGSDERQYCSPGFDLPVGSLMRSMYLTYPEYHTSLDDLELVTPTGLASSLAAYLRLVQVLELDRTYVAAVTHGEPHLARHGLYPTLSDKRKDSEVTRIRYLITFSDGRHDLLDIAERAGEPIWTFGPAVRRLLAAGLLHAQEGSP